VSAWIKSDTLVGFDVTAMAEQAHSLEPTDCARLTPPWQPQEASFNELSHFPKEAASIPCGGQQKNNSFSGRLSADMLALLIARTVKQFT